MADPTVLNESGLDAASRDYVAWVADALSLQMQTDSGGGIALLPLAPPADNEPPPAAPISFDTTGDLAKLWDLQRQFVGGATEAQASGEPSHVPGIAAVVLEPYKIRDGRVQLAGCTLEPRPFLRISTLGSEIEHHWFGRDGIKIDTDLLNRLNLDRLDAIPPRLKPGDQSTMTAWIDAAASSLGTTQRIGVTVAWSQWVAGKVRIQFDQGAQTSLAFQGWAIEWEKGLLPPPMFKCPITDIESYDLVCTEDGTITAREGVGRCELTQKEVLRTELGQCAISGKNVLVDMLTTCPISDERFLTDLAKKCEWCKRLVSPHAMDQKRCKQCSDPKQDDALETIASDLQTKHPEFSKLSHWKGWVSPELALLVGRGWISETLVLISRPDLQILRTGTRQRFSRHWRLDD
ncbi:hypothetical protein EC9_09860 [Rosistilla ulvae]|uniref:Uncharacterized protein n=1 Tax=Rosistilla ulvae TaxID=1930277 RepID=A0A517LW18_9BACT|nr:hypothetical protein [Rosistilla ulvae]QDS86812.1 hypothetical protein EC9_09860 [Rosistilla ulvae]